MYLASLARLESIFLALAYSSNKGLARLALTTFMTSYMLCFQIINLGGHVWYIGG